MGEPGRMQAFLGWWRELPTGWRVNAGLYALAGLSLIALLAQIAIGGGSRPRRVDVAAQAPRRPTTTFVAPSTTEPPSTTVPPTTAPPATAAPPAPATTRARSGGGGASPPPATFQPAPTTALACRNSRDPACGQFSWDPPPGGNAGLQVVVSAPQTVEVGKPVQFSVTVSDPDHVVTGNCTEVSGGPANDLPCNPPSCPPAHGPWTPPPRHGGSRTFPFTATYDSPGARDVAFTFRTDRDTCPDPYGSVGTGRATIEVVPAAGNG